MRRDLLHIAMYHAVDSQFAVSDAVSASTLNFLGDINPYIFKDHKMFDPAYQAEWDALLVLNSIPEVMTEMTALDVVKAFLSTYPEQLQLLECMPVEDWNQLCKKLEEFYSR